MTRFRPTIGIAAERIATAALFIFIMASLYLACTAGAAATGGLPQ
ncbi:hypothetical protein [Euryhalocaulis caribicus]|nr:hypothetical protein [Euryhalocaulis caribicus]